MEQQSYSRPLPRITPLNEGFWAHARNSVFALQVCTECGDAHIPESPVCPRCLSENQTWQPSSGKGKLESWVDFHRAYWDGFKEDLPYRVCLIRLDGGPLIISNLVGSSDAKFGARVHVVFEAVTDEITLPKFALDEPHAE